MEGDGSTAGHKLMQTVPALFDDLAKGNVRPISYALRMSFDKAYDDTTVFFKLDDSLLDGNDILTPNDDNPIQAWDYYKYADFSDRVQSVEWSQEIEFPFSVSSALADFTLANHDDLFTPNSASPIADYVLPKRPVRIYAGFNGTNIPQFVGLTEKMPVISDRDKTAAFHAVGFLAKIYTMKMNKTIAMSNVRTDEVLAAILEQFGLTSDQYSLDRGRNIIPFLFYEKDSLAGDVLRKLMQAEMGNLWLDEQGIIRFSQRLLRVQTPVYVYDETNTNDIKTTSDENIINTVKITSQLRALQEFQVVYAKSKTNTDLFVIGPGASRDFEAQLQDPCQTVEDPTFGEGSGPSWYSAALPDGSSVPSGVNVTATELRTNTFVITFENTNSFSVNIDQLEVWGEPGRVYDTIKYTETDQSSIDKYEEQVIEIDNPFIQSIDQCDSLALSLLDTFSEYANQIEIDVKGSPAQQLNDVVYVNYRTYVGDYRIISIKNRLMKGEKATQIITAVKYTPRSWFYLDESLLDGTDELTP